ncbi:hypothetical protein EDD21DRAFT_196830 [Dissophora ornata]|nr:hypothetical protein EDD21DRAFT_196830 [Dissophora ornata]
MILNRSSHERGFGYGVIYGSEIVDLGDFRIRGEPVLHHFGLGLDAPRSWRGKLDKNDLLCIGVSLQDGDPICSYIDDTTGKMLIKMVSSTRFVSWNLISGTWSCGRSTSSSASRAHPQVLVASPTEGCVLAKVALSRHAILGIRHSDRCHHQYPRFPVSYDNWRVR